MFLMDTTDNSVYFVTRFQDEKFWGTLIDTGSSDLILLHEYWFDEVDDMVIVEVKINSNG